MAEDLVTYLSLTPEFGGTKFGPFEGLEVRLGSDPDRCHIVLPEALGVVREHVKLIRQGPVNLILAPADRTATVYLWKQGERRPTQLNTPTAVRPGDAFSLVTQDGPRFNIEVGELPPELREERDRKRGVATGRRRLSAESMGTEVKRQAWTKLLVLGPAQFAQRAMVYIRSGAIYQPRNIILFMTIASGWIFGGFVGCRSGSVKKSLATTTTRYENCQQELVYAEGMSGSEAEYSIDQLAASITRSTILGNALKEDSKLREKVVERAKLLLVRPQDYEWVVSTKGSQAKAFKSWRERVLSSEVLDPDTAGLLVWLGAQPGLRQPKFIPITDSEGTDVCARGQASLTYRQAVRLGMSAQPDAYFSGPANAVEESNARMAELVLPTMELAQVVEEEDSEGSTYQVFTMSTREQCIYREGEDDRTTNSRLVRQLERMLGEDAALLPPPDAPWGSAARLAKLFAADITKIDYADRKDPGVDFSENHISTTLAGFEGRGDWVLARTAEVIARSIVLPCMAVLEGDSDQIKAMMGDALPGAVECLVLDYRLRRE